MSMPLPLQGLHQRWRHALETATYAHRTNSMISAREGLDAVLGHIELDHEISAAGNAALYASNVYFQSQGAHSPFGSPELKNEALRALLSYEQAVSQARPNDAARVAGFIW